jgi:hypothetical protein
MSYDIRVAVKVEGCGKFADIAEPEYSSPTYNLRDMFVAATGWNYKQGEYYKCTDVMDNIKQGIQNLTYNNYSELAPSNGWGTQSSAIHALQSMKQCIEEQAKEIPMDCLYVCW